MPARSLFRQLRIAVLLLILAGVALDAFMQRARTHDWSKKEWVAIYPIGGDPSATTRAYLTDLDADAFRDIETFVARQAAEFGIDAEMPVDLQLRHQVLNLPPPPPDRGNALDNAWWSLKLRYWAWRETRHDPQPDTRIRLFVIFHNPDTQTELPHSHGLRELLLGVAHVFAGRRQQHTNNVVIAHELMHTLGATDKYDVRTNQPIYPHGYAEPQLQPLYPQRYAEIMGGRTPVSAEQAVMPPNLRSVRIGILTATEIAWTK